MLQQDYLMRILVSFAAAMRRSMQRAQGDQDPRGAADMLEAAVGEATDMDGGVLLSLAPESIADIMQVSGVDPRVTEYIARSLLLSSAYLREAGEEGLADVRTAQAVAIAKVYGFDLPENPTDFDDMVSAAEEENFRS